MAQTREQKLLTRQKTRARELTNEFLDCRSLGHAWREVKPDQESNIGELHEYQCMRCKSIRVDIISLRWGELLARHYRPAPGYLMQLPDNGERIFSAAALRAERVRRFKERAYELPDIEEVVVA